MKLPGDRRTRWRSRGVAAHLAVGALWLFAGCAASPPSAGEPPSAGGPPAPTVQARLADGRPMSDWAPGQPVPCRTVDDCQVVAPSDLRCPGCCGFCGGGELAPRGIVPLGCARPPSRVCAGVSCAACPSPGPPLRRVCGAPEPGTSLGTCRFEVDAASPGRSP